MKFIKLSVVVLALVVCEVLSVPAPPSQPDRETVEAIKKAIARRAVAGDTAVPPTTTPDGDLQTDETFLLATSWGLGYPSVGFGVGLGWGYGGYGLGGYGGYPGYGLGGYGGYGLGGLGGYGYPGYGGYGLGYGLG